MLKLRVHIVPVGYEIDRVIEPSIRYKADKVWLIIEDDIEKKEAYFHYIKIKERLSELDIVVDEKRCDIHSLFDLLNAYRMIIEEEARHELFINVSTGNKIEAIAGMMASMIFSDEYGKITPYYVVPENYEIKPKQGQQFTSGYHSTIQLPNYKIERPKESLISALRIIQKNDGSSKKILIELFLKEGLIKIEKENFTESAKHSQLNKNYLEPLREKELINIKGKGRAARIFITKDGKNILKFLPR